MMLNESTLAIYLELVRILGDMQPPGYGRLASPDELHEWAVYYTARSESFMDVESVSG